MPKVVRRLLESHNFLNTALEKHGHVLVTSDAERLVRERDRVFYELMTYESTDPQVTLAQIRFGLACLADFAKPSPPARQLRDICVKAAGRLAGQAGQGAQKRALEGLGDLFNFIPDRASLVDKDYRFIRTNHANARFHEKDASDFAGQPIWKILGSECFEKLSKPKLDACFSGKELSHVAQHRASGRLYFVSYLPFRLNGARTDLAMIVARDVTKLAVPADVVWPEFT